MEVDLTSSQSANMRRVDSRDWNKRENRQTWLSLRVGNSLHRSFLVLCVAIPATQFLGVLVLLLGLASCEKILKILSLVSKIDNRLSGWHIHTHFHPREDRIFLFQIKLMNNSYFNVQYFLFFPWCAVFMFGSKRKRKFYC